MHSILFLKNGCDNGAGALELELVAITIVDGGCTWAAMVDEEGGVVEFTASV
jgi:hypothetical protein